LKGRIDVLERFRLNLRRLTAPWAWYLQTQKHKTTNPRKMKNVFITALALIVIAVSVSSCKSKEKCEAYSSKASVKVDQKSY
jgi:hypothetical protein